MWFTRSIARGFASVALVFKLLIPVGYMPASLAEGGPVRLCSDVFSTAGGVPLPTATDDVRPSSTVQAIHSQQGKHAAHPHTHPHIHGEHDYRQYEHGHHHDDDVAGHHTWERCYLGGLSFQAALTYEWRMPEPAQAPSFVLPADTEHLTRSAIVAFRSRAPPTTPV